MSTITLQRNVSVTLVREIIPDDRYLTSSAGRKSFTWKITIQLFDDNKMYTNIAYDTLNATCCLIFQRVIVTRRLLYGVEGSERRSGVVASALTHQQP